MYQAFENKQVRKCPSPNQSGQSIKKKKVEYVLVYQTREVRVQFLVRAANKERIVYVPFGSYP